MDYKVVSNKKSYAYLLNLKSFSRKELKVGWFENLRYENGEYVANVAAQNEFGNPNKNIPPRPFMRPTISREQNNWSALIEKLSERVGEEKMTSSEALDILGLKVTGDIKESIKRVYTPPLAPATIAARLAKRKNQKIVGMLDKPLIDTSQMIDSVSFEVSHG